MGQQFAGVADPAQWHTGGELTQQAPRLGGIGGDLICHSKRWREAGEAAVEDRVEGIERAGKLGVEQGAGAGVGALVGADAGGEQVGERGLIGAFRR